jgi:hypothetical protein
LRRDTCCAGAAALAATLGVTGCTHDVYLPPARMLPLESAATLAQGETGMQLEGGAHGAVFGVAAKSGTVRVRRGVDDANEVSAEVSVLHVDNAAAARVNTYPNVFAIRGGAKHRVTRWFSVMGGLGGGASDGGGFCSPDVGGVVAFENPYLVPFLSARAGLSVPFDARRVDTGAKTGPEAPPTTGYAGAVIGARVPLGACDTNACGVRGSLLAGVGFTSFTYAGGEDTSQTVLSAAGGAEIVF